MYEVKVSAQGSGSDPVCLPLELWSQPQKVFNSR